MAAASYPFEYHVAAVVVLEVVGEVHGVGGVGKSRAEELGHVEGSVGGGGLHAHIKVAIVDERLGVVLNALVLPGSGADELVAVRRRVAVVGNVMIRREVRERPGGVAAIVKADLAILADAVLLHRLSGLGLCGGGRGAQGASGQEDS